MIKNGGKKMMEGYEFYKELDELVSHTFSDEEKALIEKAYEFAYLHHKGQKRKSGEEYIIHPVAVATILIGFGLDYQSVIAALLHDVVEDTDASKEDVSKMFGSQVAELVDGVTKLSGVHANKPVADGTVQSYFAANDEKEKQQAENLRKLLLAMSADDRVIIIKLADRLHNMRTLRFMPDQKRRDISRETLEIYAPIAHRLGIRPVKEELEDLAIRNLDPVAYNEIEEKLREQEPFRKDFLESLQKEITEKLEESQIKHATIYGRIKSVHGIYKKMYVKNKQFDEIYDVYAVRIIVDSVADCYGCLGLLHEKYTLIPGRFKDYIGSPKPNGYSSLHTSLIGERGVPFEVQIRTYDMHKMAEYGIAAHWKYKLGMTGAGKRESGVKWVRPYLEEQTAEGADATELLRSFKSDLASEEVYVLTPKGEVKALPAGSTVIDFAYSIHSQVGNKMIGAKVNNRIVPFTHVVRNGDIVEVMTTSQRDKGPSRDWLSIVTTGAARQKIKQWFKKEGRAENIPLGRQTFEKELRRFNMSLDAEQAKLLMAVILEKTKLPSEDDFYNELGYGGLLISRIMPMIRDEYNKIIKASAKEEKVQVKQSRTVSSEGVVVEGISNCLIKLSRCCNPIPGDDIIGFITRGHGVSVHKRDCTNVPVFLANCAEPERWIKVYWNNNIKSEFSAALTLTCIQGRVTMNDIFALLNSIHVTIQSVNSRDTHDGRFVISLTINANSVEHLNTVKQRLLKIGGVTSVERGGADK